MKKIKGEREEEKKESSFATGSDEGHLTWGSDERRVRAGTREGAWSLPVHTPVEHASGLGTELPPKKPPMEPCAMGI